MGNIDEMCFCLGNYTLRKNRKETELDSCLPRFIDAFVHHTQCTDCRLFPEDKAASQVLFANGSAVWKE